MMTKVSIIIPFYNAIPFLEETLESAFNQTHQNIEVIAIDDGSADGSYEYLQSLQHPKLTLIKNKGKGACSARNYGLELASGDYIQYLDADDLLSPNKIEAQLEIFKTYGDDIIVNGAWGRFYDNPNDVQWATQHLSKDFEKALDWLVASWMGKGMTTNSAWLTHRNLIENAGPWDERLTINQDGEFFSRVLMQAKAIKFCKAAKMYYRSGLPGSISQSKKTQAKAASLLLSYQLYKQNLSGYIEMPKVKQALGNNFLNFIYQYHNVYPDLVSQAEKDFYDLNVGNMWPVGGKNFKRFARLVGFNNALKIKGLLLRGNL
ncbi:glycosyltransferase family 2 protein [Winogradskyella pacifica]|uniref:glycosyltransferase family 2 protein n=1 Tax=Winogradskyella pacifica TaxID=664642 RepID=UPI0015CD1493|nr:glycosyltransferase family 2 protein [Winogradskyella pacifica]